MAAAQAKADRLHTHWMAKLDQLRQDHPDYPEGALAQLSLMDARLELEASDRQAAEQWQQANTSALLEHTVTEAVKRERVPRKEGGENKNAATNAAKERCKKALIEDPAILEGRSNMNAARILSSRGIFIENNSSSADDDRRKGKVDGSLTIKQVAAWIGTWKRTGEI